MKLLGKPYSSRTAVHIRRGDWGADMEGQSRAHREKAAVYLPRGASPDLWSRPTSVDGAASGMFALDEESRVPRGGVTRCDG